jgi:flavin reductase (DIM6/NTAB) family NADH-FMN oxidoreductase RutF
MSGEASKDTPSLEPAEFRRVLGHFATGVTVVTSRDADGPGHGLTASAVASVSLHPPLALVCVGHEADTHDVIERTGAFAINVLGEDAELLARRFAEYAADEKFAGVAHRREATGAPVLDAALAWADCELEYSHEGGDHTIFVGRVVAGDAREGSPLLYFRGGYRRMAP